MGGLKRLFLRILPLITLICFICFGITHTFTTSNSQQPITYLTHETITLNDNNTIDPTDDTTIDNYTFDFQTYQSNINANLIKAATEKTIDIDAYRTTLSTFNILWEDGYQAGDIIKTIGNAVILVINTLFVGINIFLLPIRIASAVLLTGLSILGININRTEGIIIPFLRVIVEEVAIPLINQTDANDSTIYNTLTNTTWTFYNQPEIPQNTYVNINTNLTFTSNNQQFNQITITNTKIGVINNPLYSEYNPTITYNETEVYSNGSWINNNYKTIFINNVTGNNENTTLSIWLQKLATKQTTQPIDTNTYQWYETPIAHYETNDVEYWVVIANIESNNELFTGFILAIDSRDWIIAYSTNDGNTQIVCENNEWTNIYYRQFKILNTEALPTVYQNYFTSLQNNNFVTIYNP